MSYDTSTQKRHWQFASLDDLTLQQRQTHEAALQLALQRLAAQQSSSQSTPLPPPEFAFDTVYSPLLRYHLHRITHLCSNKYKCFRGELPAAVCNTACCLFARFYCRLSMLQYRPAILSTVCVYMACKLEEHYIKVDEFAQCSQLRTTDQQSAQDKIREIHALEPVLLEGVRYSMRVWQPLRALKGFVEQFKQWQQQQQTDGAVAMSASLSALSTHSNAPPVTLNAQGRATRRRRTSNNETPAAQSTNAASNNASNAPASTASTPPATAAAPFVPLSDPQLKSLTDLGLAVCNASYVWSSNVHMLYSYSVIALSALLLSASELKFDPQISRFLRTIGSSEKSTQLLASIKQCGVDYLHPCLLHVTNKRKMTIDESLVHRLNNEVLPQLFDRCLEPGTLEFDSALAATQLSTHQAKAAKSNNKRQIQEEMLLGKNDPIDLSGDTTEFVIKRRKKDGNEA